MTKFEYAGGNIGIAVEPAQGHMYIGDFVFDDEEGVWAFRPLMTRCDFTEWHGLLQSGELVSVESRIIAAISILLVAMNAEEEI